MEYGPGTPEDLRSKAARIAKNLRFARTRVSESTGEVPLQRTPEELSFHEKRRRERLFHRRTDDKEWWEEDEVIASAAIINKDAAKQNN